MVKRGFKLVLFACILYLAPSESVGLDGTALISHKGEIFLYDIATEEERLLVSGATKGRIKFSPDGKKVAYARANAAIHIIDINSGEVKGLSNNAGCWSVVHWESDYIYWLDNKEPKIYRINVETEEQEVYYEQEENWLWGGGEPFFTSDASVMYNHWRYNLTGEKPPLHLKGDCSPSISPSGNLISHNNPGHYSIHLRSRDTLETCCKENTLERTDGTLHCAGPCEGRAYYDTIWLPPAVWGAVWATTPHADDDWMLAECGDYNKEERAQYICVTNIRTKKYYQIQRFAKGWDFWPGPLPTSDGPVILLDKKNISFSSEQTTPITVSVSNNGSGTLGTVTVDEDVDWLTVEIQGEGNDQKLVNSVNIQGLSEGSYTTTVSVGGGSANNTATYTVVVSIGNTIAAPTEFEAVSIGRDEVKLTWTDNTADETGYAIERAPNNANWQEIAVTQPDITMYQDSGLGAGNTYFYRIRTVKNDTYSSYAGPDTVEIPEYASITILSPNKNDTWTVGTTAHIKWTATNCDNVEILISTNGGRTWPFRPLGDNVGSSKRTDDNWGDITFTVPDLPTNECHVRIQDYNDPGYVEDVGPLTITTNTGIHNKLNNISAPLLSKGTIPLLFTGNDTYSFTIPGGSKVGIYKFDGSHIVDIVAPNNGSKIQSVTWNGRNATGQKVGPGCYVALIHDRKTNNRIRYPRLLNR